MAFDDFSHARGSHTPPGQVWVTHRVLPVTRSSWGGGRGGSGPVLRYIPAVWAMISFIISEVPPPMVSMRTSLQARAMFVSSM